MDAMTTQPLGVEIFAGMESIVRANCRKLPGSGSNFVLFFSASDGNSRATVVHAVSDSFDEAWQQGQAALRNSFEKSGGHPRWTRVDWVEKVTPSNWRDLRALLSATKRNYFRFGLALDEKMERVFLEHE